MRPPLRSLLLTLGASILVATTPALASPIHTWGSNTIRQPISETSPNVNWAIDTSDASLEALAQAAVQKWQDVDSAYITFTQVEPNTTEAIRFTILDSLSNAYAGGQALATWNADGEITECTIELLAAALTSGDTDYQTMIFAHEFGHCLGLSHSVSRNAVMSYRDPAANLTADDRYALTLLYPSDGVSLPLGCASISKSPPSATDEDPRILSVLFSALIAVFGFFALRSRKTHFSESQA